MTWDPTQYQRFGDERSRPFFELTNRIDPTPGAPATVVDLGCGPGNLTATLAERWPAATVIGVDNDEAMLRSSAAHGSDRVRFELDDIAEWTHAQASESVDVIVSNAALQWVPGHRDLLPLLLDRLRPGGTLAFQVPGNLTDAHHQAIHALRQRAPWDTHPELEGTPLATHASHRGTEYLDTLSLAAATAVDAWETTYLHVLHGPDPILEWVKGTALRPILGALTAADDRDRFCDELAPMLRAAYPSEPWGTPFPFRRVFAVARR